MKNYLPGFVTLCTLVLSSHASAECREERTIGVDRGQARYNCEAVLKGDVNGCRNGGNIWYCSCSVGCRQPDGNGPGQRWTRTIGVDWRGARTNCELILKGEAVNCKPYGSMWACECYY